MAASPSISIAVIGSGGAGALTTGNFLLEVASSAGWHGLFTRTLGPQIRGGEAAGLLRLAVHPVDCLPDQFDLIISIDWLNAHRFGNEIKVGPQTLVISDPRGGKLPPLVTESGSRVVEIAMKEIAKSQQNRRHPAAGRGRTRRDQHDHRLVLWRHAGADGDIRPRALADDRGNRACDRRRNPDCDC